MFHLDAAVGVDAHRIELEATGRRQTFHASGTGSLAVPARLSWDRKSPLSASSHSDVPSTAIESTADGSPSGGSRQSR